jgi:beta-lactamase superfamily II metal-dependent hydrolase
MSTALIFVLDGIGQVLLTGDMSNEANRLFMKAYENKLNVDIAKCGWHGDGGAMLEEFAKFVNAICWYWNYHHSKKNGGRSNTLKKLLKAGVRESQIYMNYEDGDITFTYHNGYFTVTKSKDKKYAYVFEARHHSAA